CVAYTGSYGKGLLTRMVESVRLLDGTAYAGPSRTAVPRRGHGAPRSRPGHQSVRKCSEGER
ncbi:hypothetical protein, partial [Streptomyces sp. NPDC047966]|uniref:hypothetical protein n=1 Tax=Streptomyces sp. NPDC047966 TaxID=3155745 RepID=UPI003447AB80